MHDEPLSDRGPSRRAVLFAMVALAGPCGLAGAAPAPTRPVPAAPGPVVLTVSGAVGATGTTTEAKLDMAMLAALPQHSFVTRTPWYPKARKFTGVRLRDLLAAVGAGSGDLRAIALNDYRADIPREEIAEGDVMVAYLLDDQPMRVRDKGPLVVIYPFDARRDLRTAVHYSRAVWQLHRLEVK